MSSTKMKNAPHLAALAKVNDLDEQERAARARRDAARAHLADLQTRNNSGDQSVTGLDLMTARADVEAAEGLADAAARALSDARSDHGALLAEHTASEVLATIEVHDLDRATLEAARAVETALTTLSDAMAARDAASDAAGQKLADAGVQPGQWVNGVRYVPVRMFSGTGPVVRGQFNVEVQTADGGTAWLSSTGADRDAPRTLTKTIDAVVASATAALPMRKGSMPTF